MSIVAAVSRNRKSMYKWKPRPLQLLWRLKEMLFLFLLIFGLFFQSVNVTLTEQNSRCDCATCFRNLYRCRVERQQYVDKIKRNPAMISFMKNTTSSNMADHNDDFIMKIKLQFFPCFLKVPNGWQVVGMVRVKINSSRGLVFLLFWLSLQFVSHWSQMTGQPTVPLIKMLSVIVPLTGKQTPGQPQITDPPSANDSTDNITRQSSCSSFQILSRSSSSSSVAGVSSHGSEGPQLVPQGTSGVLGAGLLAASFGGGVPISNAAERLKNELIPASMLVLESELHLLLRYQSVWEESMLVLMGFCIQTAVTKEETDTSLK